MVESSFSEKVSFWSLLLAPGLLVSACMAPSVGGGPNEAPTPTDPGITTTTIADATTTTAAEATTTTASEATTTTASDATTTTAAEATTTTAAAPTPKDCAVIDIEAESLQLRGDWKIKRDTKASGGAYITWEGLDPEKNVGSPADILTANIEIKKPGTYEFVWAMRQPDDVKSDRGNDSYLNFPDASTFRTSTGIPITGFVKVFGNSKEDFAEKATTDFKVGNEHIRKPIVVEFDEAGTYKMEIGGRSHGHQIDRILLHEESISRADAISGKACDT